MEARCSIARCTWCRWNLPEQQNTSQSTNFTCSHEEWTNEQQVQNHYGKCSDINWTKSATSIAPNSQHRKYGKTERDGADACSWLPSNGWSNTEEGISIRIAVDTSNDLRRFSPSLFCFHQFICVGFFLFLFFFCTAVRFSTCASLFFSYVRYDAIIFTSRIRCVYAVVDSIAVH